MSLSDKTPVNRGSCKNIAAAIREAHMLSVIDLFKIGIGPSSSHTMGPMRISKRFLQDANANGVLGGALRVEVELQGSLALTGIGHGTDKATILGLIGFDPTTTDPEEANAAFQTAIKHKQLKLHEGPDIEFRPLNDIVFRHDHIPELHPNGMTLRLFDAHGREVFKRTYYSTGGGFFVSEARMKQSLSDDVVPTQIEVPFPYTSAQQLRDMCIKNEIIISHLISANEDTIRAKTETQNKLDHITDVMMACVSRGLSQKGVLPGGLSVHRRAPDLYRKLKRDLSSNEREALFDALNVYAMAVNEENASGGRVVTAPTNGAAGILPALMRHYCCDEDGQPRYAKAREFLLVAGGIGILYKQRASISGAEMGCQGEVGVACSMASAGLVAVWGGDVDRCLAAAVIGMEHNLGLTCDPVGGLVQIPCIERNAIGAVKAVNAARLAMHGTGQEKVTLDQVIETMRQTGEDMSHKYKETSLGGLAVNVVEC